MGIWHAILHIFYVVCVLEFSVLLWGFVGGREVKLRPATLSAGEFLLLLHKGTPGKQ